jgi:predicted Rossmann fold flavoprotein
MADPKTVPASETSWDVIVIGAGAAGLLAAATSASRGHRTLLLEKNRKLGVKILISGGTRCNLTQATNQAGIAAGFPKYQGKFLRSALAAFPPERIVALLHQAGVDTKVEATGKVFPVSDRAVDVRDALVEFARNQGSHIQCEASVTAIDRRADQFAVSVDSPADTAVMSAAKVIVACGGRSYAGCGTTGDGYAWARTLGHSIVQPVPALTPIRTSNAWVHRHSGLTLADARLLIVSSKSLQMESIPKSTIVDQHRGSLLFTHFGFSGPAALNVSRAITRAENRRELVLVADLVPAQSATELTDAWNRHTQNDGKRSVSAWLAQIIPQRLAASTLVEAGIPGDRRCAELSKVELRRLVRQLKQARLDISGTMGFDKAEVTAGGVSLAEVDSRTLESKLVPGLHFVGEILDIDGQIGGYNFQAAFSSGWQAGQSV